MQIDYLSAIVSRMECPRYEPLGYTGASRLSGDEQQADNMWCLIAIAIAAKTIPPVDCSFPLFEECLAIAAPHNREHWKDNIREIDYLYQCVSVTDRNHFLMAQQLEAVKRYRETQLAMD